MAVVVKTLKRSSSRSSSSSSRRRRSSSSSSSRRSRSSSCCSSSSCSRKKTTNENNNSSSGRSSSNRCSFGGGVSNGSNNHNGRNEQIVPKACFGASAVMYWVALEERKLSYNNGYILVIKRVSLVRYLKLSSLIATQFRTEATRPELTDSTSLMLGNTDSYCRRVTSN